MEQKSVIQDEGEDRIFCVNLKQEKLPKTVTKVELINIQSPVEFSAINKKHKRVFLDIRHCLNALYNHVAISKEVNYIPMEDELVVMFFAAANCWCRGRVLEVHSDYTATIRCVDYGNVDRVQFCMIRKPDEVLQHFSMQAIDMQIAHVELVKEVADWSESDKWRFKQVMPRRQEYIVSETYNRKRRTRRLMVLIQDCLTKTDIRSKLISLGFVRAVEIETATPSSSETQLNGAHSDSGDSPRSERNFASGDSFADAESIAVEPEKTKISPRNANLNQSSGDYISNIATQEAGTTDEEKLLRRSLPEQLVARQQARSKEGSPVVANPDLPMGDLGRKKSIKALQKLSQRSGAPATPSGSEYEIVKRPDITMSTLKTFFPGKELEVRVMHVGERNLYVHNMEQSGARLRNVMWDMKKYYADVPPLKHRPPVNSLVAARPYKGYAWNNEFNRAQVLSWAECDTEINVFFLDYGETATVPLSDVRKLEPCFMKYKFQAVAAQMDGLKPDQVWPDEIREKVIRLLSKKLLKASVVELLDDMVILHTYFHNSSFTDFLIKMGLKPDDASNPQHAALNLRSLKNELPKSNAKKDVPDVLEVVVLHAESVDKFFVVPHDKIQDFCDVGEKLQEAFKDGGKVYRPPVTKRSDELVVNYSPKSQEYLRAMILDIRDASALVKNLDWGYQELVPLTNLFRMSDDLMRLPEYALNCSLGVVEVEGSTVDLSFFDPLKKFWQMKIEKKIGKLHIVNLIDEKGESLKSKLIEQKLVKTDGEEPWMSRVMASSSRKLPPRYVPSAMNQFLRIVIVDAKSLDEIFVHVIEEAAEILAREMSQKLEQLYKDKERPRMIAAPGDFIIVEYGPENTNYRAVVQERVKNNRFRVHFVDFGNEAIVERLAMSPLPLELREYPRLAVKCKLNKATDVEPLDKWPASVLRDVSLAVFVKQIGEVMMVELYHADRTSVKDRLAEMSMVEPSGPLTSSPSEENGKSKGKGMTMRLFHELPPFEVPVGVDCVITFVDSVSKFFIQVHDDDNWHIEQVTTFLQRYYAKKESQLGHNFKRSELEEDVMVVAKYPLDDKMYRGRLVKKTAWDEWHVFFVDFGDTEVVPVNNMLPLADVFMKVPPLAIEVCRFIDIDETTISTEDLCDFMLKVLTLKRALPQPDSTYAVSLALEDGSDLGTLLST